jgi:hypothetical protein
MENLACENALIIILPLFEFKVERKQSDNIDPVALIDDRARKYQSFCAKFLMELRTLRHLVEGVVRSWSRSSKIESDEYKEIMVDVLELLEELVSHMVPGSFGEVLVSISFVVPILPFPFLAVSAFEFYSARACLQYIQE